MQGTLHPEAPASWNTFKAEIGWLWERLLWLYFASIICDDEQIGLELPL